MSDSLPGAGSQPPELHLCPYSAESIARCPYFRAMRAGLLREPGDACHYAVTEEAADGSRRMRCWRGTVRPAEVLIAEAQPDLRQLLRLRFRAMGFYPRGVDDGAGALDEIRGWTPDAVIADNHLPDVDGTALLEAMRDRAGLEETPVILLCDDDCPDDITGARVVSKWAAWSALREVVQSAMASRPPHEPPGGGSSAA